MALAKRTVKFLNSLGRGAGLLEISERLDADPDDVLVTLKALKKKGEVHRAARPPSWQRQGGKR